MPLYSLDFLKDSYSEHTDYSQRFLYAKKFLLLVMGEYSKFGFFLVKKILSEVFFKVINQVKLDG